MNQDHFWNLMAKNLSGEASEKEKAELATLMQSYPELSLAAQQVTEIWSLKEKEKITNTEAEQAYQQHLLHIEKEQEPFESRVPNEAANVPFDKVHFKRKWNPAFVLIALSLVAATCLVLWQRRPLLIAREKAAPNTEVYSRPGTRTKLVLPDGSAVWLNAGSKLSYPQKFGGNERGVTLSGEAFFDVVKAGKPFIIHTAGVQIKVLGTAFNVRSYPAEKMVETSLVRGRVEITQDRNPDKKYVLQPAEKLTLNTAPADEKNSHPKTPNALAVFATLHYLNDTTIAETSWVENKLVFDDESFADVARKMERWYGVSFLFTAERLERERFTGVFEKETVWQALTAMQLTTPFHYAIKNNQITITP